MQAAAQQRQQAEAAQRKGPPPQIYLPFDLVSLNVKGHGRPCAQRVPGACSEPALRAPLHL